MWRVVPGILSKYVPNLAYTSVILVILHMLSSPVILIYWTREQTACSALHRWRRRQCHSCRHAFSTNNRYTSRRRLQRLLLRQLLHCIGSDRRSINRGQPQRLIVIAREDLLRVSGVDWDGCKRVLNRDRLTSRKRHSRLPLKSLWQIFCHRDCSAYSKQC